jgi:mobilization protein NikA
VVKPPLRTKTLGTKVSEEEFAQLEAAASERGLTLSEWCREMLLASVNGQGEKSADSDCRNRSKPLEHSKSALFHPSLFRVKSLQQHLQLLKS